MAAETKDKEEKKLGPSVTYQPDDENDKTPIEYSGVVFTPGQSVNVEDAVGAANAEPMLKKLAGNRFFKVDGGVDHKEEAKKRDKQTEEGEKAKAKALDDAEKAKAKAAGQTPNPPDDWKGPDKAELESDSAAHRPPLPKAK